MTEDNGDGIRLERKLDDGGLIEFEERPTGYRAYHYTPKDGKRVRFPSVTTILGETRPKRALLEWYEEEGAKAALILERKGALKGVDPGMAAVVARGAGMGARDSAKVAAKRGTSIHSILENWARNGTVPNPSEFPPEYRGYIRGLIGWLLKFDPVPTAVERLIVHPELGYAGRLDLRATIGSADTLVDLKTNRRAQLYDEAALQVTAYAYGDMACGAPAPDQLMMVAVGPDGSFAPGTPGYGTDKAWRASVDAYRSYKSMGDILPVAA